MSLANYNLPLHPQFAAAIEKNIGKRRMGRASAVPAGTTFIVSNFPAFAGTQIIDGGSSVALTSNDGLAGSFIFLSCGIVSGNSCKFVTATAATRRQWNPRLRMKFLASQSALLVRQHYGLFSAEPSALAAAGLGAGGLSAAVFNYDTGVDTGGAVGFWGCECANAVGSTRVTTGFPLVAGNYYEAEIVINDLAGNVEFWMADHGPVATVTRDVPLKLIATIQSTLPVAATPLLAGQTTTTLTTVTRRSTAGEYILIQD